MHESSCVLVCDLWIDWGMRDSEDKTRGAGLDFAYLWPQTSRWSTDKERVRHESDRGQQGLFLFSPRFLIGGLGFYCYCLRVTPLDMPADWRLATGDCNGICTLATCWLRYDCWLLSRLPAPATRTRNCTSPATASNTHSANIHPALSISVLDLHRFFPSFQLISCYYLL